MVGALPHEVAQGLRRLVGRNDRRQQTVPVPVLDPLAIATIGLGPALDLPGEGGRGGDDVEAGFEEGEEQDMAVGAGSFEGDGGDTVLAQPSDQLAQAGRVGGKLADGRGAAVGIDADPVGGIADIDAGGTDVLHRQRCQFGAGGGFVDWHRHERLLG